MMYWDGSMGTWGYILSGLSFILFWGAVIAAIVLFARSAMAGRRGYGGDGGSYSVAEHLLAERFARGEIDESEYLARLAVLRRGRSA
ncbi:SHOCT domain-containing protein [Pseudarthrobacter sp. 1G09]|uniref:SHOCT domain-containing protein n=1 Tax=Pseudarthrobacter sp. 1G09 TaxID=3416178 RepID=UPI003CECA92A